MSEKTDIALMGHIDDIHARAPVDKMAARVVMWEGEHWEPKKKILTADSALPLPTRSIDAGVHVDLTGRRVGLFKVLGISATHRGRWVVRCNCGTYSLRRSGAITNSENVQDRCEVCRHLVFLKRQRRRDSTGKWIDIRTFA